MSTVTSADGTVIGYERSGSGPALILVDGAMCYRAAGPMRPLAQRLTDHFSVVAYDRRGRGESGDTLPFAPEREVEDLAALVDAVGGTAYGYSMSSGAGVVLAAAAAGVPFTRLLCYEPPYTSRPGDTAAKDDYTRDLAEHLAAGRRGDAVARFMAMVGMPAPAIEAMRHSPAWAALEAIAPTLAYDNAALGDGTVPTALAARVKVPTLVVDGGASPDFLRAAAAGLAEALPDGSSQTLPGQTHDVDPDALAPALIAFFAAGRD
jgi:pimeloyl-ACP methyl ester carboxylesterase